MVERVQHQILPAQGAAVRTEIRPEALLLSRAFIDALDKSQDRGGIDCGTVLIFRDFRPGYLTERNRFTSGMH